MGFLNKVASFFNGAKSASWNESRFFDGNNAAQRSTLFKNPTHYLAAYESISYAGQCASKISTYTSQLKYTLKTGEKEIKNDLIELVLSGRVAGFESGLSYQDFYMISMLHLLLSGEIFWLVDYRSAYAKARRIPDSFIPIPPSNVEVFDDSGVLVTSSTRQTSNKAQYYRVNLGHTYFEVTPSDIIATVVPGPYNTLRGIGVVQQNASYLDQVASMTIFNQMFFKNGARSNGFVTPKDADRPPQPNQVADIKKQIREEWSGAQNWGKLLYIPSALELQKIELSHNDMQYLEQMRFSREDINAMFSLPPIVAGIMNDVKYDSAAEQMRVFYDITCKRFVPFLEKHIQKAIKLIDKNITFATVYPRYYEKSQLQNAFDRGVITRNEYRQAIEFETVSGLDDYYMTMQLIPAEDAGLSQYETEPTKCCDTSTKSEKKNDNARLLRRARRTKARTEKRFAKDVADFYAGQLDRILKNLDALKSIGMDVQIKADDIDRVFNSKTEKALAKKSLTPAYQSAVTLGVTDQNELHGTDIDDTTQNPKIVLVVEKLATRYANRTIDSRREELKTIISDWRESGDSWNTLKQNVQTAYVDGLTGAETWKAHRIARTEASYAWDQSAFLAYDVLGVKTYDVIGCMDSETDCNKKGIPADERDSLEFHPNHTGIIVPA